MPDNSFKGTGIAGNLAVTGNLSAQGNIVLGNATTDTITMQGGYVPGVSGILIDTGTDVYIGGPVTMDQGLTVSGVVNVDSVTTSGITMGSTSQTDDGTWGTISTALNYGTVTQATTIAAPSSPAEGKRIVIRVKQGGGGSLTWNSIYEFGVFRSSLSSTANAVQLWEFVYNSVDSKWNCQSGPVDADLAAIAGVTSAADKVPYFTGAGTADVLTCTSAARTVLDDTTVAAMVDTLGGATSTGTGGIARATSPIFVTPTLGAATATSIDLGNGAVGDLFFGTWTPTASVNTNISPAPTNLTGIYSRVGSIVAWAIFATVDTVAGANTATLVEFTLPVSSDFSNTRECIGSGVHTQGTTYDLVTCYGNSTNNTIGAFWYASGTASGELRISGMYQII